MEWVFLGVFVLVVLGAGLYLRRLATARQARALADAREEALRWYERLGGQIMNLSGDDPAVRQALVDAGERYNAAGAQLDRATTARQYELAGETALEGLQYARAARVALGLDPGPELPALAGQRAAGVITKEREVDVQGHVYRASPQPGGATPYYYPGGHVQGRPVPGGWYSEPWWKTALVAGAWGLGSMMIFNALLSPAWGDTGHAAGDGGDSAGDGGESGDGGGDSGGDGGDAGGGDAGGGDGGDYGASGDYGGAEYSGDYSGGDYGGGDFGGGDFGGGDF